MNILSVGNSFSENAHTLLPRLMAADGSGDDFMLCNLYIGGCSLERHWNNLKKEEEAYDYQVYLPGEVTRTDAPEVALHEPVEDEDWDFITVQQVSGLAGVEESYSPYLEEIVGYLRLTKPNAKILFHQTWEYSPRTGHPDFARYGSDSEEMFRCINHATSMVQINADIDGIIPSGMAFHLANQTALADQLYQEDGFHANPLGCYLGAGCFYEKITGKSIMDNPFVIPDYPPAYTDLLKVCIHTACEQY